MKLWVDDERPPPEGWEWAKTFEDAFNLLRTESVVELDLDNDLGGAYEGRHLLNTIERWVHIDYPYQPPRVIRVHSANPAAREAMEAAINAIERAVKAREEPDGPDQPAS